MDKRNILLLRYKGELTKQFLEKEYIQKKKSISQLQRELGKDWNTIKYYLQLYKLPLRTHKEQASISSLGGNFLYNNLLTQDYLINQYNNCKKGVSDLARELKIDKGTIRRYLKKYNFPIRTSKEQKIINHPPKEFKINEKIKSFIDGLLLGDASIPKRKDGIKPRSLTQACKYKEYLEYIKDKLEKMKINCSPILSRWVKDERCKNKGYHQSFLQTRRYKTFELFRDRWYPKGKKIIPKVIIINRDILLQSYLSDGNFYREIRLCLDAFTKEDILFLKGLIENELKIKSECKKFLNYIGLSPVKCYKYKWTDNESEEAKERKRLKARLYYQKNKNGHQNL